MSTKQTIQEQRLYRHASQREKRESDTQAESRQMFTYNRNKAEAYNHE